MGGLVSTNLLFRDAWHVIPPLLEHFSLRGTGLTKRVWFSVSRVRSATVQAVTMSRAISRRLPYDRGKPRTLLTRHRFPATGRWICARSVMLDRELPGLPLFHFQPVVC